MKKKFGDYKFVRTPGSIEEWDVYEIHKGVDPDYLGGLWQGYDHGPWHFQPFVDSGLERKLIIALGKFMDQLPT